MNGYKILNKQHFSKGSYSLVPIRFEDRYHIMRWRNEQMYHLRQQKPLTIQDQDSYFQTVVSKLFDDPQPLNILFSFLKNNHCVGYGGLVHINWIDRSAEISFLMDPELESEFFGLFWSTYLNLIQEIGFAELGMHKMFTYAYDVRPHLYPVLEREGFQQEAVFNAHTVIDGLYYDVCVHSKFSGQLYFKKATLKDAETTFNWANDAVIRKYAFQKKLITFEDHQNWFNSKLNDPNCHYWIAYTAGKPAGSLRLDRMSEKVFKINYLLDVSLHGIGMGKKLLQEGIRVARKNRASGILEGDVFNENIASIKIFKQLGFVETAQQPGFKTFRKELLENS